MLSALARAALRRPGAMLAGALAALVVAAALAAWAADRLPLAAPEAVRSESERAADELDAGLGREAAPGVLIVTRGKEPVDSGVYGVAVDVITSQAETHPGVAAVRRGPVSRDGRTTALEVYFADDDPRRQQDAVGDLHRGLDPGTLDVAVGGQAGVLRDARDAVWGELGLLELLALPVTVLVLALALGPRLFFGPVLAAGIGLLGSVGLTGLLNEATPLSVLGVAPAAVVAVVVAIEACLILAARHREERATLGSAEDAMHRTLETAGRAVVLGSLGAAAMAAALAIVPVLDARSAALGGVLAALLTGATALVSMPSLLVLSGAEAEIEERGEPSSARRDGGLARRFESAVTRSRPLAAAVAVVPLAALLALAAQGTRLQTLPIDAAGLPDDSEAHRAEVRATAELGTETTAPVLVSAGPAERAVLKSLRLEVAGVPGVGEASGPSATPSGGELLRAGTESRPGSIGAREAIEGIRNVPSAPRFSVGGRDAEALDADRALLDQAPIAAGAGALLLALVLFAVLRPALQSDGRATLPSAALAIVSLLPAVACVGVLVLVFQDARLTDPLDYAPQGGPAEASVIAAAAGVAAVSGWRTVQLADALAVERGLGVPSRAAVAGAVSLTLPAAAAATLVAAAATIVLAGSDLAAAKELGIATAAGIVLDLVLCRTLLVPAVARLSQ
jgi:putative drug exporter of the RND superfamily